MQKRIDSNADAWLAKAQALCTSEAAAEARAKRNELLALSDSEVALDRLGLEVPSESGITAWLGFLTKLGSVLAGNWASYRQQLRDLPQQPGFPFEIEWPDKPTE